MLTQKDFDEIEKLVKDIIKEEIKFLPTKNEFYKMLDELMGEIKAVREEQELHSGQHSKIYEQMEHHDKRLLKLENPPPSLSS